MNMATGALWRYDGQEMPGLRRDGQGRRAEMPVLWVSVSGLVRGLPANGPVSPTSIASGRGDCNRVGTVRFRPLRLLAVAVDSDKHPTAGIGLALGRDVGRCAEWKRKRFIPVPYGGPFVVHSVGLVRVAYLYRTIGGHVVFDGIRSHAGSGLDASLRWNSDDCYAAQYH